MSPELCAQVRAAVPLYLLTRRIKSLGFKVVMSGEGADEVFGGYLYFHKAPSPEEFHRCALLAKEPKKLINVPCSAAQGCGQKLVMSGGADEVFGGCLLPPSSVPRGVPQVRSGDLSAVQCDGSTRSAQSLDTTL